MKTLILTLLAAIVLLVASGTASAAQVSVQGASSQPRDPVRFSFSFFWLLADPGERNEVELRTLGPRRAALRDAAGPLTTGFRCAPAADGWAECDISESADIKAAQLGLGDGDDLLRIVGTTNADATGGPGDDRLYAGEGHYFFDGGEGDDELVGGPGRDSLAGAAGADTVRGGDGDDLLFDAMRYATTSGDPIPFDDHGRDEFDGGAGQDVLSYAARSEDLMVDLGAGLGPDGDVLRSIEGAVGGTGADVLRGSAGDDLLDGGVSAGDTLIGLAGDDTLTGRGAGTTIVAGPGDDTISGADLDAPVSCGPGEDRVVETYAGEIAFPGRDCERIETTLFALTRIEPAARRLSFVARAVYPARTPLCGLRAFLRTEDGRRELARAGVRIPDRARRTVTLTARRGLPARVAVELRSQRCDRRGRMSAAPAQRTLRFPLEVR